jgi:hypothetical protein
MLPRQAVLSSVAKYCFALEFRCGDLVRGGDFHNFDRLTISCAYTPIAHQRQNASANPSKQQGIDSSRTRYADDCADQWKIFLAAHI